jgi:predicted metallopeptidase
MLARTIFEAAGETFASSDARAVAAHELLHHGADAAGGLGREGCKLQFRVDCTRPKL